MQENKNKDLQISFSYIISITAVSKHTQTRTSALDIERVIIDRHSILNPVAFLTAVFIEKEQCQVYNSLCTVLFSCKCNCIISTRMGKHSFRTFIYQKRMPEVSDLLVRGNYDNRNAEEQRKMV